MLPPFLNVSNRSLLKHFSVSASNIFQRIHSLILYPFYHSSILHFLANVTTFLLYAPPLYSILGERNFITFLLLSTLVTGFTFLIFAYQYQLQREVLFGATGISIALRTFTALLCRTQFNGLEMIRDHIAIHLMLESLFGHLSITELSSIIGGMISAFLFLNYGY
jgi:membrane associated rhomboid family serine protease